ncbi:MAG: DUF4252 domain-containing protein [Marinifilaceae bacterium]
MKNILIVITLVVASLAADAQTKAEKLYREYSNKEGFTSFSFSGSFMNDLDIDIDDSGDNKERKVTGDIQEVKFMTYNHNNEASKKIDFSRIAMKELNGGGYKQVLKEKNKDQESDETYFYAKGKGKRFTEFHVLNFNENRTTLVSFYGKFLVDELENLSRIGMSKIEN